MKGNERCITTQPKFSDRRGLEKTNSGAIGLRNPQAKGCPETRCKGFTKRERQKRRRREEERKKSPTLIASRCKAASPTSLSMPCRDQCSTLPKSSSQDTVSTGRVFPWLLISVLWGAILDPSSLLDHGWELRSGRKPLPRYETSCRLPNAKCPNIFTGA